MQVSLHTAQYEIATDPHRFKVICAGRRFGKSVLARMIMLKWATTKEGLYWIVAPTFQQGKDIHWLQGFKKEIPSKYIIKWNDSELSVDIRVVENGKTIGTSRIQIRLYGIRKMVIKSKPPCL